jgi:hypothetical protein
MEPEDFRELACLIRDVIAEQKSVKDEVIRFRSRFLDMRYCFSRGDCDDWFRKLHEMI